MAAPNVINVLTATERSTALTLTTTSVVSLLSSTAGSSQSLSVRSLYVGNPSTGTAINVSVLYYSQAALAGTAFPFVPTISLPALTSLVIIDRNSDLSIEEDRSLGILAGTASSSLSVMLSWSVLSTN